MKGVPPFAWYLPQELGLGQGRGHSRCASGRHAWPLEPGVCLKIRIGSWNEGYGQVRKWWRGWPVTTSSRRPRQQEVYCGGTRSLWHQRQTGWGYQRRRSFFSWWRCWIGGIGRWDEQKEFRVVEGNCMPLLDATLYCTRLFIFYMCCSDCWCRLHF